MVDAEIDGDVHTPETPNPELNDDPKISPYSAVEIIKSVVCVVPSVHPVGQKLTFSNKVLPGLNISCDSSGVIGSVI